MYKQPGQEEFLFYMLYTGAAVLSLIACCYLLFRRGNAFAPDIKSSERLRRWTAALFASTTLSHAWYLPGIFLTSDDDIMLHDLVGGLLDCMTVLPLSIAIMICMLQDRKRPLWLAWLVVAPLVAGKAVCLANLSYAPLPLLLAYLLLLGVGLLIYMIRAIRQYGHWLRDNYADLEHKEVWQSFVVLAFLLLISGIYEVGFEWPAYDYVVQVLGIVVVCYLVWRVETLSDLSIHQMQILPIALSQTLRDDIGPLLKRYCEEPKLYLQHDLTLAELCRAIGTNRTYLAQYFSSQGITYNAYINTLRINHFVNLYRDASTAQRSLTAQQLANECGFHSYRTFSDVFKRVMNQSVSVWIKAQQ
jgi:AraC-like DNA-binding protein